MTQRAFRFHNMQVIIVMSVGIVLLVTATLWVLGREVVRLQLQTAQLNEGARRDTMESHFQEAFLKTTRGIEDDLSGVRLGETSAGHDGGALVILSPSGLGRAQPPDRLPFQPIAPKPETFDETFFEAATALEYREKDLPRAAAALAELATSPNPVVSAEARVRLARVQAGLGQTSKALATLDTLGGEKRVGPFEVPYGFASRFDRCILLERAGQRAAARMEADALISSLEAGEWTVGPEAFDHYDRELRALAGRGDSRPPAARLAIAVMVQGLFDDWKQSGRVKRLTASPPSDVEPATLAIAHANRERLAVIIYTPDQIEPLVRRSADAELQDATMTISDERGRPIVGPAVAESRQPRRLAEGIGWTLHVTGTGDATQTTSVQASATYLIVALTGVVLLVCAASYAMVRGVVREATAGRLQSDFVSAVSHEFRSPLTTLRQLTELLGEGRIEDERRRQQYFTVMQAETSRLHQLVENLLDFGRMDAGRGRYRPEPIDLSALVQQSVEAYRSHAAANGHAIEMSSIQRDLVVEADREALSRAVRNLLENAVKYSPDASTVWVETGCEREVAVLRVRDQGIGIPDGERSRIFDKFVRGEAAKRACIQGTGIGLAMVREIVRAHRGEVEVDSEVGRGSTFLVRLPLHRIEPVNAA